MNRFEYLQEVDDLGVTIVQNAFLNHYMPKARGDYVKVYLYGLKCCGQGKAFPTNAELAAVSYTHLDVYKRQCQRRSNAI